jgi:excisionase family DNA binding protein
MTETAIGNIINSSSGRLTTFEAAEIIGVKPQTLISWRCTKKESIPYYKIGRKVFYKKQDILEWVEQKRVA